MRAFLDLQGIQSATSARRGIARYATDLTTALLRNHADSIAGIGLNPLQPLPTQLPASLLRSNLVVWNTSRELRRVAARGPLAFHALSPFEMVRPVQGLVPAHVVASGMPLVSTLYDVIPHTMPDFYLADPVVRRSYRRRLQLLRQCDLLLAISEHARRDAIELLDFDPERIAVVGAGASEFFRQAGPEDRPAQMIARMLPDIRKPFVLSVTGEDPRKNTPRLLEAWALLPSDVREDHQLVISGRLRSDVRDEWRALARRLRIHDDDAIFTDYVDDATLRSLYQRASLFAFASRSEGFGLPVLEAARCGCPAVTSNATSLPEVLDWEPATFAPDDAPAIASAIQRGIGDDAYRADLQQVGKAAADRHTWSRVADRVVDAYAHLDRRWRRGPTRVPRPRLAFVGPLGRDSALGRYHERLAADLITYCDLDCIVTGSRGASDSASRGHRRFPASAFGSTLDPASYDGIVYACAGADAEVASLAERYPGILWLHDPGAFARTADAGDDEDDRFRIDRAHALLVGTDLDATAVRLFVDPFAVPPPVVMVPLAIDTPGSGGPVERESEPTTIVALGAVAGEHQPEMLVGAVASLTRTMSIRLVFVGAVEPRREDELHDLGVELGVERAVHLTGAITHGEQRAWLGRATVAVQLSSTSTGVGALVLAEVLAAGVPTITSEPMGRELPPGVVRWVDPDIEVSALASGLAALLRDTGERRRLVATTRAFAATRSFDALAHRIADLAFGGPVPRTDPVRVAMAPVPLLTGVDSTCGS